MPDVDRDELRTAARVDAYVVRNRYALSEFEYRGQNRSHGISPRTLDALARRGLVWFDADMTGGLTPQGVKVLREMENADA